MEDVIISNYKEYKELIKTYKEEGINKIHILSDFDRTITYGDAPLIKNLRNGQYLSKEYAQKAHELYEKYHPLEIDPNIPIEEKKRLMHEWWSKHFKLLIKYGLSKKDIEDVINRTQPMLRQGAKDLFRLTYEYNIPFVIMSAGGLGKYAIEIVLKKNDVLYPNVYIISNEYVWDKEGKAIDIKEPIIHSMNKDEAVLKSPFYKEIYNEIKDKKNVILMGDIVEDIKMAEGIPYDHLLKIGFLNEKIKEVLEHYEWLEHYKKNFDVVITNNGSMDFVVDMMKKIIGNERQI